MVAQLKRGGADEMHCTQKVFPAGRRILVVAAATILTVGLLPGTSSATTVTLNSCTAAPRALTATPSDDGKLLALTAKTNVTCSASGTVSVKRQFKIQIEIRYRTRKDLPDSLKKRATTSLLTVTIAPGHPQTRSASTRTLCHPSGNWFQRSRIQFFSNGVAKQWSTWATTVSTNRGRDTRCDNVPSG